MRQGHWVRIIQRYIVDRERGQRETPPAVTISRTAGAGGLEVARCLQDYLQERRPRGSPHWVTFDRNLIDRVLEEQNLPKRLAEFMPERRISQINAYLGEALGLHPSTLTLARKQSETIVNLARSGHAILVGRGGCVVARKLSNVLHVRIVGSLESRIKRVMRREGLSRDEASAWIRRTDRDREAYFKQQFNRDANDPALFHMSLSSERYSVEEVAEIIGTAALRHGQSRSEKLPSEKLPVESKVEASPTPDLRSVPPISSETLRSRRTARGAQKLGFD